MEESEDEIYWSQIGFFCGGVVTGATVSGFSGLTYAYITHDSKLLIPVLVSFGLSALGVCGAHLASRTLHNLARRAKPPSASLT